MWSYTHVVVPILSDAECLLCALEAPDLGIRLVAVETTTADTGVPSTKICLYQQQHTCMSLWVYSQHSTSKGFVVYTYAAHMYTNTYHVLLSQQN